MVGKNMAFMCFPTSLPSQCLTCVELLAEVGPHEFLRHLSRYGVDDQLRTEVEERPVGSGDAALGGRGVRTQIGDGDDVAPNGTAEGRGLGKEEGERARRGLVTLRCERRRSAADRPTGSQPARPLQGRGSRALRAEEGRRDSLAERSGEGERGMKNSVRMTGFEEFVFSNWLHLTFASQKRCVINPKFSKHIWWDGIVQSSVEEEHPW